MKKKMCPKWVKPRMVKGIGNMAPLCINKVLAPERCPKNTNSKCEIVEPMVKVKAWIYISPIGQVDATNQLNNPRYRIPGHITYDKKYLKGEK